MGKHAIFDVMDEVYRRVNLSLGYEPYPSSIGRKVNRELYMWCVFPARNTHGLAMYYPTRPAQHRKPGAAN